jgi:hypothetical protein
MPMGFGEIMKDGNARTDDLADARSIARSTF